MVMFLKAIVMSLLLIGAFLCSSAGMNYTSDDSISWAAVTLVMIGLGLFLLFMWCVKRWDLDVEQNRI